MAMTVEATFQNGVFVPVERPLLAEHQRVRLTVEPEDRPPAPAQVDPQAVERHRRQRIRIDPEQSREIASSAEFLPEES